MFRQPRRYPLDALGPLLGPAARGLEELQQVPAALAVQSVLAAAATVVQSRYDVVCDGRTVPLSLWLALVAAPGERKTSTDAVAFRLLYQRQREAAEQAWTNCEYCGRVYAEGEGSLTSCPTCGGTRGSKPAWL